MMKKTFILATILPYLFSVSFGQDVQKKDIGEFREVKPGFYQNEILKSHEDFESPNNERSVRKYFAVDLKDLSFPTDLKKYSQVWHNKPLSQGNTGTCWCFSAISFFESEIFRTTEKKVKLSEMYIVYWEYVERAKAFVRERGNIYFAQGSEANAVIRIMKQYGAVPLKSYPGTKPGQKFHFHSEMFKEMNAYLKSVKETNAWNENQVAETIKSILSSYMGAPPEFVIIDGKTFTPQQYLKDILQLKLIDYFSFMSTLKIPYNQKGELVEADNWWHCDDYYNISLDNFFFITKNAIDNGYSVSICGDVSEPGHDKYKEASIIPTFDIPSFYIDESSREYRLENRSTTDDHCIHVVGYYIDEDEHWFLIKDSGSGAFDGPHKGYRFFHPDYVKLKMMNILVHKEAAREVLDDIIK